MKNSGAVEALAKRSRVAAAGLATLPTEIKDCALLGMADMLEISADRIVEENARDLAEGSGQGFSAALMDRLTLTVDRVGEMARGLREVASLRDPVGEVSDGWKLPNGLAVERVRVPLGVVGIIYEARPNVTVDAAGLCVKSGNAVVYEGKLERNKL